MPAFHTGGVKRSHGGVTTAGMNYVGADDYLAHFDLGLPSTWDYTVSKSGTDVIVQNSGGSTVYTGTTDGAFSYLDSNMADGSDVMIEAGTYTLTDGDIFFEASNITWYSEGTVILDDGGTPVNQFFRLTSACDSWDIVGGTYDMDVENNTDDGNPGTQRIWSLFNCTNVTFRGVTLLNAQDTFIQDGADNVHVHHCTMDTSGERGTYLIGDMVEYDFHNCLVIDVASGAYRGEQVGGTGASNWFGHHNYITTRVTPERAASPIYLFGSGPHDLTFYRNRCEVGGVGSASDGYVGYFRGTDSTGPTRNVKLLGNRYTGASGNNLKYLEVTSGGAVPEREDEELINIPATIDAS